jgi:hypothetical protein
MAAANTKRILLTDAAVKREPLAEGKPRIVRDTKVAGLHLWVGKRKKTFRYQYEAPRIRLPHQLPCPLVDTEVLSLAVIEL